MSLRLGIAFLLPVFVLAPVQAAEEPDAVQFQMRLVSVPASTYARLKDDFGLERKKTLVTDDKGLTALLAAVQEDAEANVLSSPRVMTLLGQSATVEIGQQHMLVTGARIALNEGKVRIEPELSAVSTGFKVMLTPNAPGGNGGGADSVELDLKVISSQLGGVERIPVKVEKLTQVLEKAQVLSNTVERKFTLPFGKTAVIAGWWEQQKGNKEPQRVIVFVTAEPGK